jgi:hypothetical protein
MKLQEILSLECVKSLESLLEEHCPLDGSGVNRRFLLEKSGLISSLVEENILPEVVLTLRKLEDYELVKFKEGKKLPENFPFPSADSVPEGKDYIEVCYEWWKTLERKLDAAAELIVVPVSLGLTKKFVSRRGANGGICRVLETESESKLPKKASSQDWSDIGLPENFIQNLQSLLEEQIPPGALNAIPARLAAQLLKLDIGLAPKISQAIKLGKIIGFTNVQNKGIVRNENSKQKRQALTKMKESTNQVTVS